MKVNRKKRFEYRMADAAETRARNGKSKVAERKRRDNRMVQRVSAGSPPYTHDVMCWLSRKLDKPSNQITPDDVKTVVKAIRS